MKTDASDIEIPPPAGFNPWRGRIMLLSLAHAMGTGCYLSIMAMGPLIREDMGISAAQFGFFMSAIFSAQLISAMPSGTITDRMGVGWTLFGALIMMMTGTLLFAYVESFYPALAATFLIGLGYSFVNPATAKGVVRWFPAHWRGTAMGLKQLGVPLGGVLGAGGGALAAYVDWRIVLVGAAALALVVAMFWLPLTRKPNSGGGGFRVIVRDLKTVVTNRNMNVICISSSAFNAGQSCLFTYMALFLRDAAQASQLVAAMGVAFAQSACAIGRVGYSFLSDRYFGARRKWMVVAVIVAGAVACGVTYFVNPAWPHWGLMILAVAMGGTIAAYAALILSMAAESVPSSLVGSAIGYNALAWSVGGIAGPPLFGWVLDMSGNTYGYAWMTIAVIMLLGAAVLAQAFREGKQPDL